VISWIASYNGGSVITGYKILIRQSDNFTFSENVVDCAGSSPTIVSETKCTVPIVSLKNAPYSLPWGSHVYAKVSAINIIGSSAFSAVGNGA
jgi:hypothetical protein